jgi:hypothetical protein
MSETTIEIPTNQNQIVGKKALPTIRPYVDKTVFNMGLENYNLALHDGTFHDEQLMCLEVNGVLRYVTGLNEFAPEVKKLPEEQKKAKIKQIRQIVAQLEMELATNVVDPEDKDFWSKVVLLRPDNHEFWGKISIRCGNEPVFLDPVNNPHDLIKLCAIEAGGFSIIAPSYEWARSQHKPPKFYLDKAVETMSTKTELKKLRNKAKAELEKLYAKNINKLFYIMKVIEINSIQYKKSTPPDILYDNADTFIDGNGSEPNERKAITAFSDAAKLDMETLKIRAIIKDATFLNVVYSKPDGFVYHRASNVLMGRGVEDITEYLKNPLNEQILSDILSNVEKQWNL